MTDVATDNEKIILSIVLREKFIVYFLKNNLIKKNFFLY